MRAVLLSLFALILVLPAHGRDDGTRDYADPGVLIAPELAVGAADYRRHVAATPLEDIAEIGELRAAAEKAMAEKRPGDAVAAWEAVIALGDDGPGTWQALANTWAAEDGLRSDRAFQAAYNAYLAADSDPARAAALGHLGQLLADGHRWEGAIDAYGAALALVPDSTMAETIAKLKAEHGFRVSHINVDSDRDAPRVCFVFSGPVKNDPSLRAADYLEVAPATPVDAWFGSDSLCVDGLAHRQEVTLTLRAGVPGAEGHVLSAAVTETVRPDDRPPSVTIAGAAYVLPRQGATGIPVTTVNTGTVHLELVRINDRNLIDSINFNRLTDPLSGYDVENVVTRSGTRVWRGTMAVESRTNRDMVTAVPVTDMVPDPEPGVYILTAWVDDDQPMYHDRATQWLVISDIGLTTLSGEDGLTVAVRSLAGATPMEGVTLRLIARNNGILGEAVSDDVGFAHFDAGLIRGAGGDRPAVLMAYGPGGDYVFLDLTGPAFDLTDRGVAGRAAPGPLDAVMYTERGVYRPGETVQVMTLLRGADTRAVADLPLTFRLMRPDGVEIDRFVATGGPAGGYHLELPMTPAARAGTWSVQAHADPEAAPVGRVRFQVEDFVPMRLEVDLAAPSGWLAPDRPLSLDVAARFLYGAPAADLPVEAELVVRRAPDPYPGHPGYHFGLAHEDVAPERTPLVVAETDGAGKTTVPVRLGRLPDTPSPLEARIRVSVFEPSGRPANALVSVPVRTRPFDIGLKPEFADDRVAEGREAAYGVLTVGPDGAPVAGRDLTYEWVREIREYHWFHRDGGWTYKVVRRDKVLDTGRVTTGADGTARLARLVDWGNYRLDVYDTATGAAASHTFDAGWQAQAGVGETPDKAEVALDRDAYAPGDTARVFVKAPFAGRAMLVVANEKVFTRQIFDLPAEGATVELAVDEAWLPGAYVLISALRPGADPAAHGPDRAVGTAWLGLDTAPWTLDVALDLPEQVRPRQTLTVPVQVTGAQVGDESLHLTLAAVDEGILMLTGFESPAPEDVVYGKRQLAVDMRDLYGRLIDGRAENMGVLRTGGDDGARNLGGPKTRSHETVALFHGPVDLDSRGRAEIDLEIPDFNGRLRLMAVAWGATALGSGDRDLVVRDPVVAELGLPRFLAPGDEARLALSLHNVDGPAGDYRVTVAGTGAVEGAIEETVTLAADQRRTLHMPLSGDTVGDGTVTLALTGPDLDLERTRRIAVRPAQPVMTERVVRLLPAGKTVSYGPSLVDDLLPGTADIALAFSTRPDFDVPALLTALDRFPYGCVEQTVSRALPLVYLGDVAREWRHDADQASLDRRIAFAIARVLDRQRSDGGFGLWTVANDTDAWLSAYALDFLGRARAAGHRVPDFAFRRGLDYLQEVARRHDDTPDRLASVAYALYVLTREGAVDPALLRYVADTYLDKLPTAMAQAQIGAALARRGELDRASAAFARATDHHRVVLASFGDYGTPLRDRAAVITLMAEAGVDAERILAEADRAATAYDSAQALSTQEQVWLLLAAHAMVAHQGEMSLEIDGVALPPRGRPFYLRPSPDLLAEDLTVGNLGSVPVRAIQSVTGVPEDPRPAAQAGFALSRGTYAMDGTPIDLDDLTQNDLVVVVIEGEATSEVMDQRALVVDLLPAGLEIENANIGAGRGTGELRFLPELTPVAFDAARDDRYIAALDLDKDQRRFAVAYIARAVTPGDFVRPAAYVEDMYKPFLFARTDMDRIEIDPRE